MRLTARGTSYGSLRGALCCGLCGALLLADHAGAALPPSVAHAFLDQRIPLSSVSAYVQEIGAAKPLFTHCRLERRRSTGRTSFTNDTCCGIRIQPHST